MIHQPDDDDNNNNNERVAVSTNARPNIQITISSSIACLFLISFVLLRINAPPVETVREQHPIVDDSALPLRREFIPKRNEERVFRASSISYSSGTEHAVQIEESTARDEKQSSSNEALEETTTTAESLPSNNNNKKETTIIIHNHHHHPPPKQQQQRTLNTDETILQPFSTPLLLLKLARVPSLMSYQQENLFEATLERFFKRHLQSLFDVNVKIKSQMMQRTRWGDEEEEEGVAALILLLNVLGRYAVLTSSSKEVDLQSVLEGVIGEEREDLLEDLGVLGAEEDGFFEGVEMIQVLDSSPFQTSSVAEEEEGRKKDGGEEDVTDGAAIVAVVLLTLFLMTIGVTAAQFLLYNDRQHHHHHLNNNQTNQFRHNNLLQRTFRKTTYSNVNHHHHPDVELNIERLSSSYDDDDDDDHHAVLDDYSDSINDKHELESECFVPKGPMGVAIRTLEGYPVVYEIKPGASVEGVLKKFDKIVAMDDVETFRMNGREFTKLMESKRDVVKKITFVRKLRKEEEEGEGNRIT